MKKLEQFKVCMLGKWPQQYKAYNLDIKENKELKSWLYKLGFFDFNINNNGHLVYYHQIIAFFKCGGIHAFKRGLFCDSNHIEIHHLNGNTLDNRSKNLVYLHKIVHTEITTAQRKIYKYIKAFRNTFKGHGFLDKVKEIPLWNRQGRLITNLHNFVMHVLSLTIKTSASTFNIKLNIKKLSLWLKKTSKNIKSFFPLYHTPINWIYPTPKSNTNILNSL